MYVWIHAYVFIFVCVYVCMYAGMYISAYVRMYIYIYMCVCVCVCLCVSLDLALRKKVAICYIWSIALYGAETWTLRAADQKHQQSFEMWCWRRTEKISWTDHVRNE